ncbi:MAG TPA: hypothetical protein VD963_00930 [Phycisphaerales bacterium]|nr:hypothetical protein [Phycisphaerales bacterium]
MRGLTWCRGTVLVLSVWAGAGWTERCGAQELLVLRSGQAAPYAPDPVVRYLLGDGPFSAAHFAAARNGPSAIAVEPIWWIPGLPDDPAAGWMSVDVDSTPNSALYAHDFVVASPQIACARLELWYAVDDHLGDTGVPGLYLNGAPVPGAPERAANFMQQYHFSADVTGLLAPGLNTFFFHQLDAYDVVAGAVYSARLVIDAAPGPAPMIVGQPASAAACSREPVAFGVELNPAFGPECRWQVEDRRAPVRGSSCVPACKTCPDWGSSARPAWRPRS